MSYVHKIGKALLAESDERLRELAEVGKEADAEIAALRARVEALEAGIERVAASADMICDDEACSPSLVRKTLRAVRDAARALLEQKP